MILKPLANVEISVTKRPGTQSDGELLSRRYLPVAALVILAVASGIVLVLAVEWVSSLLS